MENYKIEKEGGNITFWNDTEEVGIRFQEGQLLARYTLSIVIDDITKLSGEAANRIKKVVEDLTEKAAAIYPNEFKEITTN